MLRWALVYQVYREVYDCQDYEHYCECFHRLQVEASTYTKLHRAVGQATSTFFFLAVWAVRFRDVPHTVWFNEFFLLDSFPLFPFFLAGFLCFADTCSASLDEAEVHQEVIVTFYVDALTNAEPLLRFSVSRMHWAHVSHQFRIRQCIVVVVIVVIILG